MNGFHALSISNFVFYNSQCSAATCELFNCIETYVDGMLRAVESGFTNTTYLPITQQLNREKYKWKASEMFSFSFHFCFFNCFNFAGRAALSSGKNPQISFFRGVIKINEQIYIIPVSFVYSHTNKETIHRNRVIIGRMVGLTYFIWFLSGGALRMTISADNF